MIIKHALDLNLIAYFRKETSTAATSQHRSNNSDRVAKTGVRFA